MAHYPFDHTLLAREGDKALQMEWNAKQTAGLDGRASSGMGGVGGGLQTVLLSLCMPESSVPRLEPAKGPRVLNNVTSGLNAYRLLSLSSYPKHDDDLHSIHSVPGVISMMLQRMECVWEDVCRSRCHLKGRTPASVDCGVCGEPWSLLHVDTV